MDIVVTYDVNTSDAQGERRLREIAKICEGFGVRRQKSVFECRLSESQLLRMLIDLESVMDKTVDSVIVYHLAGDASQCRRQLGRSISQELGAPWVL